MKATHPFIWLTEAGQRRIFVPWLVLTLSVMAALQALGGPLTTAEAPGGIVTFEFAGDLETAQAIVESWGPEGQVYAGLNLGLDYLFLAAYSASIGLGCVLVARGLDRRVPLLARLGAPLAWGQLLAALLDSLENYGLIRVLLGTDRELWPALARWCATPKFALVGLGLLFVLLGALLVILIRPRDRAR